MALLLHVILLGAMLVAFDFTRSVPPAVPLAMKATLVTDGAVVLPPPVRELPEPVPLVEPEVQPEPAEPEPVEPEPVQPDPAVQQRIEAERIQREKDALAERDRLQRIEQEKEQERQRQAELDAKAEAKRKAEEEARLEEKRRQAEIERQQAIERQREENRREEERLQAEAREQEIADESELISARNSSEMGAYLAAIQNKVVRNWVRPATARDDLECYVAITQLPNGEVVSVRVVRCNGDDVVVRSIEAAVRKASPLPLPENTLLFLRDFQFRFTIQD
jgi:colicin import membrane protein